MKTLRLAILPLLLAALGGCASGPYYYGGTSYRMHNIGGLPVSGSLGVHVTPGGLMVSPNIVVSPSFVDWKK
ncbi:MAG: hypothetical protein AMXMBFR76_25530 [Pseudomonadota bacterium]|jgi:hypothetical protein